VGGTRANGGRERKEALYTTNTVGPVVAGRYDALCGMVAKERRRHIERLLQCSRAESLALDTVLRRVAAALPPEELVLECPAGPMASELFLDIAWPAARIGVEMDGAHHFVEPPLAVRASEAVLSAACPHDATGEVSAHLASSLARGACVVPSSAPGRAFVYAFDVSLCGGAWLRTIDRLAISGSSAPLVRTRADRVRTQRVELAGGWTTVSVPYTYGVFDALKDSGLRTFRRKEDYVEALLQVVAGRVAPNAHYDLAGATAGATAAHDGVDALLLELMPTLERAVEALREGAPGRSLHVFSGRRPPVDVGWSWMTANRPPVDPSSPCRSQWTSAKLSH
jgi:hypothetical protein